VDGGRPVAYTIVVDLSIPAQSAPDPRLPAPPAHIVRRPALKSATRKAGAP